MALTDLTRISTSGIATGTSLSGAILHGDAHFRGTQVGVNSALFDSSENELNFKDNVKLTFGDGRDFQLYHDDVVSRIRDQGTGSLFLEGDTIKLGAVANGDPMLVARQGLGVSMMYNGNTIFETTNHGAVVTGILTASSFSGPIGNTSGISTFYNLRVSNNLTVEGTTTTLDTNLIDVDRVDIGANSNTDTAIVGIQSGTADIVNLFDGGTEVLTVIDGGSVGIGTTDPEEKLHITDSGNPKILIEDTDSSNQVGVRFKTSTQDWIAGLHGGVGYFKISKHSAFGTNDYFTINGSGKVGIGSDIPTQALDVNGKIKVFGSDGSAYGLTISPDSSGGTYETLIAKANADLRLQAGSGSYQASNANILLKNGTKHIIINAENSGRVGIGTNNPQSALDLAHDSGTNPLLHLRHSNADVEGEVIRIARADQNYGVRYHSIKAKHGGAVTNNYITFNLHDGTSGSSYTAQKEVLRLVGNGNIGIGTDSIGAGIKLNVFDGIVNVSSATTDTRIQFNRKDTNSTAWVGIPYWNDDGLYIYGPTSNGNQIAALFEGGAWNFHTAGNTTPRFVITSSAFGFGESSPSKQFSFTYTDGTNYSTTNAVYDFLLWNKANISSYPTCGASIQLRAGNTSAGGGNITGVRRGGANQGDLAFSTTDASGNPVEKLRITSEGKVGINQINPYHVFDVSSLGNDSNSKQYAGFEKKTETESGQQAFGLQIASQAETSSGKAPTAYIRLDARDPSLNGSHGGNAIIAFSPTGVTQGTYGRGNLDFYLRHGGPYTFINDPSTSGSSGEMQPKLRITSAGDMGLGTLTPNTYGNQTVFTINGNSYGRLDLESGGTLRGSVWGGSGVLGLDGGANRIDFYAGSASRGTLKTNGAFDFSNTDDNGIHSLSNHWHGNHDFVNRENRVLTSNGAGWRTSVDGADPMLVLSCSEDDSGRGPERGQNYGLLLHTESQANNTYAPMIGWSNRSNSGNYNTTFAAILGKKIGQATDANWSTGQLEFYTNKPLGHGQNGYMNATPDMAISEKGYVTKPRTPAFFATHSGASNSQTGYLTYNTSGSGYYNNGDHFDPATGAFHAPIDGIYHFHFHGFFQVNQTPSAWEVNFYKTNANGSGTVTVTRQYGYRDEFTYGGGNYSPNNSQYGPSISMHYTGGMTAGQYMRVHSGLSFHGSNGYFFGGYLIG